MTTTKPSAISTRAWMRAAGILFAALAALVAFAPGCGDRHAVRPTSPIATAPSRATPASLLTEYFETAYSLRDSVLYEAMLDDAYRFEFLPEDAARLREPLRGATSWGKTDELASAGRMFRAPEITGVTLDIAIDSETDYLGEDCAECVQIESSVRLRVVTQPDDNAEPLVYAVDSPQTFVARPSEQSGQWVLYRQIDRARGVPSAREEHEEIKDLYR